MDASLMLVSRPARALPVSRQDEGVCADYSTQSPRCSDTATTSHTAFLPLARGVVVTCVAGASVRERTRGPDRTTQRRTRRPPRDTVLRQLSGIAVDGSVSLFTRNEPLCCSGGELSSRRA
jgi:hypothetical protein